MRDVRPSTTPPAIRSISVVVALAALGFGAVSTLRPDRASADARRPHKHLGVEPERLVDQDGHPIANGCGPGWASWQDGASWRFANRHTYQVGGYGRCQGLPSSSPDSCDGEEWTYEVDFLAACNLHDVAYEGRFGVVVDGTWVEQHLVYDRILDVDVDFSGWSRARVDEHFYEDMVALCAQQVVQQEGRAPYAARAWRAALDACKNSGQGPAIGGSWGAGTLYRFVRAYGDAWFKDLGGTRTNDQVGATRRP